MRDRSRMTTGVMVYPIDAEKINAEIATSNWELEENEVATCRDGEGIIRYGDDVYWLDTEGVIVTQPIDEYNPIKLDIYTHKDKGNGKSSHSMFPKWQITLHGDTLETYISDEGVPLEGFVRRFGARLESNFWGIVEFLRGIKVMDEEEE